MFENIACKDRTLVCVCVCVCMCVWVIPWAVRNELDSTPQICVQFIIFAWPNMDVTLTH